MLAPVARALRARGVEVDLIGFTTGRAYFERAGLEANSAVALLDPDPEADAPWLSAARPFLGQSHPEIRPEETEAYFTVGMRDLGERIGLDAAVALVAAIGRKAFEPVAAMERYIQRTRPDLVVSTTSPRFELALLRAARRQGVPSVALGDLFLIDEREWILSGDYADHLAVISPVVAEALKRDGLTGVQTHVTGNPAFDSMLPGPQDAERRASLREKLGLSGRTVILWSATQLGAVALDGRPYALPEQVVEAMERICARDPDFAYLLRPHPNAPFGMPEGARNGLLDHGLLEAMDAILVADVVCTEVSTMGLQAALLGKPVVCVAFPDEAGYPHYGLAQIAQTLDDAVEMIAARRYGVPADQFTMPPLGSAVDNVVRLLDDVCRGAV
jgi:hypothetical protein